MAQFDPSDESVATVLEELESVDRTERNRILTAEKTGKKRKTVLEPYGIDADANYDPSGRTLYPWEVSGNLKADAGLEPVETDEQRRLREAEQEAQLKAEAEEAEFAELQRAEDERLAAGDEDDGDN